MSQHLLLSFLLFLAFTATLADNSTNSTNTTGTTNTTVTNTTTDNSTSNVSNATNTSDLSCNGEFFSTNKFKKWGLKRPPYLTTPQVSSNLKYCKMFNNVSSCCDNTTDQAIADYYDNYKSALSNMTGGRVKKMKGVFTQYQKISVDANLANFTDLNSTLGVFVNDIKNRWILINQQIVSCAQAALRLSVGLLCTGCSTSKTSNQVNGKILLNRGACLNVSLSCFRLVQSLNNTQNSSQDDAMNLTDTLSSFIGDPVATTDNSSDASAGLFGADDGITSSRILSNGNNGNNENKGNSKGRKGKVNTDGHGKGKKDVDPHYQDPNTVVNATIALFLKAFPYLNQSSFIVCGPNMTDNATRNKCDSNPTLPQMNNSNESYAIVDSFKTNSKWAYTPIFVNITLSNCPASNTTNSTNGTANGTNSTNTTSVAFELHFLFTHLKPNQDMLKFLTNKGIPCATKLNKMNVTEKTIVNQIGHYVRFFNSSYKDNQFEDEDDIKNNIDVDDRFLTCVFKEVQTLFQTQNKSMYNDTCSFFINVTNATNSSDASSNYTNVNVCNVTFARDVLGDLNNCTNGTCDSSDQIISNISGSCVNKTCIICLDGRCFGQDFGYHKDDGKSSVNYEKNQGRAQFKKDPRVSLKTGKRIPDFLELPDISFLTKFNYTPPCNDTSSCAVWFCTSFLRGPVARLEKIYNPQESSDDLDSETLSLYANQQDKLMRILQVTTTSSSDTSISDTAGVDFNQVAGLTSFTTTVTIDDVSTAADPYSNSTNSTNNTSDNGSFGERMRVVIGLLFAILLIVI